MLKKRFIAGTHCPKCNALDRIVMFTTLEKEWIECIECGHNEVRPEKLIEDLAISNEIGVVQFRPKN